MKTVLTALNARFAHSSLALRYLRRYNAEFDIRLAEFSINDNLHHMFASLWEDRAEVYGFSCYIWNMELTLKLAEMIKRALPDAVVVLGGPEAGWRAEQVLRDCAFVDLVMTGEGEETLKELLAALEAGNAAESLPAVPGLARRGRACVKRPPLDLRTMPQPYTPEDLMGLRGRIVYFETSRGCPFHCSYCLSSAEGAVRAFPMEYVKTGLAMLFAAEVPLVKLIDRTFNYDSGRAAEILRFVLNSNKNTCVHMELEPRILTGELIALLGSAPKGMFQVEMGIQSANARTLEAIGRTSDLERTAVNIRRLQAFRNMHIHLDLIAGLPYEDYESFGNSFDFVYSLRPDMLQLGFLKVLHGTAIRENADVTAVDFPPYEVVATRWISAAELCRLKEVEEAVELFYNSGVFVQTMERLACARPFRMFEALGRLLARAQAGGKLKRRELYSLLYNAYGEELRPALAEDFIRNNKSVPLPEFTRPQRERGFKDRTWRLMKQPWFCEKYGIDPDLSRLRFERMDGRAYMMDYKTGALFDITPDMEKMK